MKRRRNCLRMLLLQWQGNWVELKWLDCVCGSWFLDEAVVPNENEFSCHMSGTIHVIVMLLQTMRHDLEHGVLVNWTAWLPSTYWNSLVHVVQGLGCHGVIGCYLRCILMGMVQAKKMGFGRVDSMHRRRGIGGTLPRCLLVLLSICIAACAGTKDLDRIAERIGNYIRHDTTKLKKKIFVSSNPDSTR